MEADNQECAFGLKCRYLMQRRCHHFHPAWHYGQIQNQPTIDPCYNGPDCWYNKQGRCHFYHPPTNSTNSPSMNPFGSIRIADIDSIMKHIQEARKKKQQEERKRRQRQQEQAEIRRLQILRLMQMQNQLYAARMKQVKKSNPQTFEWYFGKNKTFKAMDVSEEKLQELDQCIICYVSFTGEQLEKDSQKEENQNQKIDSREQKPQIKETSDNKEYLQRELTELYCKHTFHKQCIKKWLSTTENCPICRKDFKNHEDYNKWQQQKKKLKPQSLSARFGSFITTQQMANSLFRGLALRPDDSDEDEMFAEEMDYVNYEDGYDEYDMQDVDYDDQW